MEIYAIHSLNEIQRARLRKQQAATKALGTKLIMLGIVGCLVGVQMLGQALIG